MTNYGNMNSTLSQSTIARRTHTVQTIDSLGITHRKGVRMVLRKGHNQTCHAQHDALRTVIRYVQGETVWKRAKSVSSMMDTKRNAHSAAGMTSGCFRYSRSSVKAAFFLTNVCEVL